LQFASAGTHAQPQRADPRTQAILKQFGYPESKKRAAQVRAQDFDRFDLILAMDNDNLRALQKICPQEQVHKLHLFLECAEGLETDQVPDPYYGNLAGFERVLDLCEAGTRAWIKRLAAPGYTR
jgi:protein-tyrosine phosphatase